MNLALDPQTHALRQRLVGTVIAGKYRLDDLLGAGSQGMVWKANNLDLDLPVAVKLMQPSSEVSADVALSRLFREARAAASLGHPGIVRIFDFGRTADGLPYLTMELLHGVSLGTHLEQVSKLSPELAVRLMLPIADALSAVHALGVVHRDVKPDNILLSISAGQMQPKLLDFGIARVADGPVLTQAGCVVGTPNYLPPEQARGSEVDARADVWALCATLYECVTGTVPFPASAWIDVLRRILEDEPEPIAAYGIIDLELWQLIRKGLTKDLDQRWSSMDEFARAAARWLRARRVSCDICGTSIESRWLRPAVATTKLANGETVSGLAWWEQAAPPSKHRLTAGRRRLLALSDVLLSVAAVIGVTRAGTWVTAASPPETLAAETASGMATMPATAQPPQLSEVVSLEATKAPAQPISGNGTNPVRRVELAPATSALATPGDSNQAHQLEVTAPASTEPRAGTDTQAAPVSAAGALQPAERAAGNHAAPRGPQTAVRRAAPDKPAAASTRDNLDLMAAY